MQTICKACQLEKFYGLRFPVTETKTKKPLEFINTDL